MLLSVYNKRGILHINYNWALAYISMLIIYNEGCFNSSFCVPRVNRGSFLNFKAT